MASGMIESRPPPGWSLSGARERPRRAAAHARNADLDRWPAGRAAETRAGR